MYGNDRGSGAPSGLVSKETMIGSETVEAALVPPKPKLGRAAKHSAFSEASVWQPLGDGWRRLHGDFRDLGVSIESHEFELAGEFDWSRSFHPESLELCLNLDGCATIRSEQKSVAFEPRTAPSYLPGRQKLAARRECGQQHRFITVEFSASFLRKHLAGCDGALHPLVEGFVLGSPLRAGLGE